jgi:hypothetical protein
MAGATERVATGAQDARRERAPEPTTPALTPGHRPRALNRTHRKTKTAPAEAEAVSMFAMPAKRRIRS